MVELKVERLLGIVRNGEFLVLRKKGPTGNPLRLTTIMITEARAPVQLNLTEYEGRAILVSGYTSGGFVYQANIVDRAGPIVTATIMKLLSER
jgi:hypothetical protein